MRNRGAHSFPNQEGGENARVQGEKFINFFRLKFAKNDGRRLPPPTPKEGQNPDIAHVIYKYQNPHICYSIKELKIFDIYIPPSTSIHQLCIEPNISTTQSWSLFAVLDMFSMMGIQCPNQIVLWKWTISKPLYVYYINNALCVLWYFFHIFKALRISSEWCFYCVCVTYYVLLSVFCMYICIYATIAFFSVSR